MVSNEEKKEGERRELNRAAKSGGVTSETNHGNSFGLPFLYKWIARVMRNIG